MFFAWCRNTSANHWSVCRYRITENIESPFKLLPNVKAICSNLRGLGTKTTFPNSFDGFLQGKIVETLIHPFRAKAGCHQQPWLQLNVAFWGSGFESFRTAQGLFAQWFLAMATKWVYNFGDGKERGKKQQSFHGGRYKYGINDTVGMHWQRLKNGTL